MGSKDNYFLQNKQKNISSTEISLNNNSKNIKNFIFKTSKNISNTNFCINNDEKTNKDLFKIRKKKENKLNELQKFFDKSKNNLLIKKFNKLKSNEYTTYFNLSNELFSLKQEKEKIKLEEMDRIFKEFQKNNYQQKFQI